MIRVKIREVAEAQGYNMSSLSRKADVSFTTIKRFWRDPYRRIDTELLERVARALGVSIHELLEEVPDVP